MKNLLAVLLLGIIAGCASIEAQPAPVSEPTKSVIVPGGYAQFCADFGLKAHFVNRLRYSACMPTSRVSGC